MSYDNASKYWMKVNSCPLVIHLKRSCSKDHATSAPRKKLLRKRSQTRIASYINIYLCRDKNTYESSILMSNNWTMLQQRVSLIISFSLISIYGTTSANTFDFAFTFFIIFWCADQKLIYDQFDTKEFFTEAALKQWIPNWFWFESLVLNTKQHLPVLPFMWLSFSHLNSFLAEFSKF